MSPTLLLVSGLAAIFVSLATAVYAVGITSRRREQVNRTLAAMEALTSPATARRPAPDRTAEPFTTRILVPALARVGRLGRALTREDQVTRIRRRLDLAGSPRGWDVERVAAAKVLGLAAGAVMMGLLAATAGAGLLPSLGLLALAGTAGYLLPNIVLYQAAYTRTEEMRRALPDSLDLLTITVEAGLTFDAALTHVARSTPGPLGEELSRVLQEMQIGLSRGAAMRALGERTDLPELRGFVTAMVQAEAFGVPVANVLRVQARDMRVKRSQLAEERAQKVPVKILFPLVFCILPALFIVVLGPAAVTILRSVRLL